MPNFEMNDNEIIITGETEKGEKVTIKLNIEDVMQVRNEYIRRNKKYVKSAIADAVRILFE